jgi:hypothetical protein
MSIGDVFKAMLIEILAKLTDNTSRMASLDNKVEEAE